MSVFTLFARSELIELVGAAFRPPYVYPAFMFDNPANEPLSETE
jgi:hypothetical protein